MVSTWDGDELSMVREHFQLRFARGLDLTPAIEAMDRVAAIAGELGLACRGQGLYRVLEAPTSSGPNTSTNKIEKVNAALADAGIRARVFPKGRIGIVPDSTPPTKLPRQLRSFSVRSLQP